MIKCNREHCLPCAALWTTEVEGRHAPQLYLLGAAKGGTTALAAALLKAGVLSAAGAKKEFHFFDRARLDGAYGALWAAGFRDYRSTLLPSSVQQVSFLGPVGVAPLSEPHSEAVLAATLDRYTPVTEVKWR